MVFSGPQRILLICLLHFCTCAAGQTVNPNTLMRIVNNFENQLRGQYAVAFRIEKEKCEDPNYGGLELITEQVKAKLKKNEVYVSGNLIAAKPIKDKQDHSEFRLKNFLKNILNVGNQCVVYFTVNSPCLDKCISESDEFSIKGNLETLQNYNGVKAFAFKLIWRKDGRQAVINKLKNVAPNLPYYQCEENKASCDRL